MTQLVNVPHVAFVELLGIQVERSLEGHSHISYTPQPDHLNSFNVVHGGVCMTLLDVALATAARSLEEKMGVVTVELKTSFMHPAMGALRTEGRVIHRTPTLAFVEGTVFNSAGTPCAHATGTFKYVRKLAIGKKQAHALNSSDIR